MSDFYFNVDVLRGQIACELAGNPEQFIWVLSEVTELISEEELAEFTHNIEHDTAEVARFWRRFADLIEAEAASQ